MSRVAHRELQSSALFTLALVLGLLERVELRVELVGLDDALSRRLPVRSVLLLADVRPPLRLVPHTANRHRVVLSHIIPQRLQPATAL